MSIAIATASTPVLPNVHMAITSDYENAARFIFLKCILLHSDLERLFDALRLWHHMIRSPLQQVGQTLESCIIGDYHLGCGYVIYIAMNPAIYDTSFALAWRKGKRSDDLDYLFDPFRDLCANVLQFQIIDPKNLLTGRLPLTDLEAELSMAGSKRIISLQAVLWDVYGLLLRYKRDWEIYCEIKPSEVRRLNIRKRFEILIRLTDELPIVRFACTCTSLPVEDQRILWLIRYLHLDSMLTFVRFQLRHEPMCYMTTYNFIRQNIHSYVDKYNLHDHPVLESTLIEVDRIERVLQKLSEPKPRRLWRLGRYNATVRKNVSTGVVDTVRSRSVSEEKAARKQWTLVSDIFPISLRVWK